MKALLALLCGASFLLLTACNTMEGMGRDVSAGGNKIQKEAEEHK